MSPHRRTPRVFAIWHSRLPLPATANAALDDARNTHHWSVPDVGKRCWNYAVRFYDPRPEILDRSWTSPKIQPVS